MDDTDAPPRRRFARAPGRRTRMILLVLGALLLLVALAGFAAHFHTAARPTILGVVAATPYLMLGAPLGLILLAVARQWIGVGSAVLVLALCVSTQSRLYIASPAPRDAHELVVMTSNLRLGQAHAPAVVAAARRHHVAVLMVQELTEDERTRLVAAGLDRLFPYSVAEPRGGGAGTGLWSRYPLSSPREIPGFSFAMVTARVAVPGLPGAPTLLALHMSGPVPNSAPWRRDIAQLPGVLRSLGRDAPVIAGGDFNSTPDTAQFRALLDDGYRDAADQAGAGMTRTFPANRWYPPLIAIDHVLTRAAVATSAETVEIPGSDHRALIAKISLAQR